MLGFPDGIGDAGIPVLRLNRRRRGMFDSNLGLWEAKNG